VTGVQTCALPIYQYHRAAVNLCNITRKVSQIGLLFNIFASVANIRGERHRMKYLSKLLFFVLFTCSLTGMAQDRLIDRVVANVGSSIILQSDVDMQYSQYLANGGTPTDDFKCTALQQLIMAKLLEQPAAIETAEVSQSDDDDRLNANMREMVRRAGGKERL